MTDTNRQRFLNSGRTRSYGAGNLPPGLAQPSASSVGRHLTTSRSVGARAAGINRPRSPAGMGLTPATAASLLDRSSLARDFTVGSGNPALMPAAGMLSTPTTRAAAGAAPRPGTAPLSAPTPLDPPPTYHTGASGLQITPSSARVTSLLQRPATTAGAGPSLGPASSAQISPKGRSRFSSSMSAYDSHIPTPPGARWGEMRHRGSPLCSAATPRRAGEGHLVFPLRAHLGCAGLVALGVQVRSESE